MAKSHFTRIVAVLFVAGIFGGCASVQRMDADLSYPPSVAVEKPKAAQEAPAPTQHSIGTAENKDQPKRDFSFFGETGIADYERPSGSLWQQAFAGYWTDWDTRPAMFRIGADYKGIRLSYFDLGNYHIAAEAGDDEGAIEACKCVVGGDTDMYYTKGNIRGLSLTYKQNLGFIPLSVFRHVFVEGGGIGVRYALSIHKDDGWQFSETLYGYGHMIGAGFEYKNVSIGYYGYRTKVGGKFGSSEYPSGTGGANVLAIGYKF